MIERIFLKITRDNGSSLIIGSWAMPKGALIDNREDQADIGWHIHHALMNDATSIEVVTGIGIHDGEVINADQ